MYIWGKGRVAGRVGSDFLSAIAGRVGSGQRFAGSGRVGSKKSDPWTTLVQLFFSDFCGLSNDILFVISFP